MFAINLTNTTEINTFFWITYGVILLFIITWVFNILMWLTYLVKRLLVIKRDIRSVEYYSEKVKELTVQLWKFRLLLLISFCEMFALLIGGFTICLHRIICFYKNDLIAGIVISCIHDFLQIICLYLILVVLKLLNLLIRYLIGVYNWHQYKPDEIRKEFKFILKETFIIIIVAGTWITTIPLGLILFSRVLYEYVKHVQWSNKLVKALRGLSNESRLILSKEGLSQHRFNLQAEKKYRKYATWIIIGIFFWILAAGMSVLGMMLNQANIYLMLQHNNSSLIDEIYSYKIYFISFTDALIFIGGGILFPVHIYHTIKSLTFSSCTVNILCYRKRNTDRKTSLKEPLITA